MTLSLAGLFGCKHAAPVAAKKAPAVATSTHSSGSSLSTNSNPVAESKVLDLGIVQMTNHYETLVKLGAGEDCRMVPDLLSRRDLQLTLTLESRSTNGQTSGLTIVEVSGSPEKPFEVSDGKTDFTFTPQVAD